MYTYKYIYLFTAWANFKNLKRRHTIFDKTEKVIKDLDEKDLKAKDRIFQPW